MLDPEAVLPATLASMTTSLGAALEFFVKSSGHKMRNALVGLSDELMLSVTALNLIPKARGQINRIFCKLSLELPLEL